MQLIHNNSKYVQKVTSSTVVGMIVAMWMWVANVEIITDNAEVRKIKQMWEDS